MTTPDPILTARLAELDNALRLAQSQVGGTGWAKECDALRAALLAAYYAGQLITAAEADARVEAAVLAILAEVNDIRARYAPIGSAEWSSYTRVLSAIRARGVTV